MIIANEQLSDCKQISARPLEQQWLMQVGHGKCSVEVIASHHDGLPTTSVSCAPTNSPTRDAHNCVKALEEPH